MVEIECLACGKSVKMPQYINTEKYDGQVVCQKCESLLHVKLVKGKVEKYKVIVNNSIRYLSWAELAKKYDEAEKRQEKAGGDSPQ